MEIILSWCFYLGKMSFVENFSKGQKESSSTLFKTWASFSYKCSQSVKQLPRGSAFAAKKVNRQRVIAPSVVWFLWQLRFPCSVRKPNILNVSVSWNFWCCTTNLLVKAACQADWMNCHCHVTRVRIQDWTKLRFLFWQVKLWKQLLCCIQQQRLAFLSRAQMNTFPKGEKHGKAGLSLWRRK